MSDIKAKGEAVTTRGDTAQALPRNRLRDPAVALTTHQPPASTPGVTWVSCHPQYAIRSLATGGVYPFFYSEADAWATWQHMPNRGGYQVVVEIESEPNHWVPATDGLAHADEAESTKPCDPVWTAWQQVHAEHLSGGGSL